MKYKAIIVEGADQQGKSTLCAALSQKLGWSIQHFGNPDDDFDFKDDYLLRPGTISDRNFISEMVYSKVKGEPSRIKDLQYLISKFKDDVLIVYVDRFDRFEFENRSEQYTEAQILEAREHYRDILLRGFIGINTFLFKPSANDYRIFDALLIHLGYENS